jgi:N-formylglutamate amidohydrolase
MQVLSEAEVIARIEAGDVFSARLSADAFEIRIDDYAPLIATAIHHGHHVCSSLTDRLLVSEDERRFEEDPYTGDLIDSLPITLKVHDSRYYYDLNRKPEDCIYEEAWGKKVWKQPLDAVEIEKIRSLHGCYYHILHSLVGALERRFTRCILYDLHSYNYSRIKSSAPLFNIGTHFIDKALFAPILEHLLEQLELFCISGYENSAVFDQVFKGKGYQAAYMRENHPHSLCVPLEIKKIFMSEQHFERDDILFSELRRQLHQVLRENGAHFEAQFVRNQVNHD